MVYHEFILKVCKNKKSLIPYCIKPVILYCERLPILIQLRTPIKIYAPHEYSKTPDGLFSS